MTILDQPTYSEPALEYANFGERLIARLIDALIILIPSMFLPFIAPWLYFALQEGSANGATVGKKIMGIRVLSADYQPIGFGTATGRFFCHFINLFTLGIGYLLMLFNARSQGLHDLITSTVVVRTRSVAQSRPAVARPQGRDHHSWTKIVSENEAHYVEIRPDGGKHRHRVSGSEQVRNFTLWQLTDGLVDFSDIFDQEVTAEMKQFAERLLKTKYQG
ncbi:MAG: RDD family protein [Chitinophagales bacterium]|nr:RDD family protein [Chitinophagales bacterium]